MCSKLIHIKLHPLKFVSNHFKAQDMLDKAVRIKPYLLKHVSGQYRTREMCNKIMCIKPASFFLISNCFRIKEICIAAVKKIHGSCAIFLITSKHKWFLMMQHVETHTPLKYVLDFLVMQELVQMCHDDNCCYNDELFQEENDYKQHSYGWKRYSKSCYM